MRKLIRSKSVHLFVVIFGLLTILLFDANAQFESGKWVFGSGGGIDFCGGKPLAFTGSNIKTSEGCSSVSSAKGDLLFYTDGVSVWNRKNELMPNGEKLNGNFSSTQSAIIVPLPDSKTLFYIFTMDWEANKNGFCYSIVDLSKSQGLGGVTEKNVRIKINCAEKLAAVRHSNNKDIWLIIHEYGSDAFCSYLLTKSGLEIKAVVSNVGIKYNKSLYNTIGYMKISPDKKKLAVAINGENLIQVFDFDARNGTISNPENIQFDAGLAPYGIEFSPNSSLLYASIITTGVIYQVNLNKELELKIQKSLLVVGKINKKNCLGALQLGVDGKIYLAQYQSHYLSAIESPNTLGLGCNFKQNAVFLNDNTSMFGLPTFFHEYVKQVLFSTDTEIYNNTKTLELNKKYILNNLYFDSSKASLDTIPDFKKLVNFLISNRNIKIEIIGHTDSIGSDDYNEKLSLARANKIKSYLIDQLLESVRVSVTGKGKREPVATNSDEIGRAKNRRVEFILRKMPITDLDDRKGN